MIREGTRLFASAKTKKEFEDIKELLAESNEDAVLFDGLEDALVGIGHRFGAGAVAVYDKDKIIDLFVKRDGMKPDEAHEHFEFNVIGTGIEHSPIFVELRREVMVA